MSWMFYTIRSGRNPKMRVEHPGMPGCENLRAKRDGFGYGH